MDWKIDGVEEEGIIRPGAALQAVPMKVSCHHNTSASTLTCQLRKSFLSEKERAYLDEVLTAEDVLGV